MNRVILIGRLTKDVEMRKTTSGTSVASFTIAVNRRSRTEGQPDADFIGCVAWNKTAELLAQYTHKGSQIGVEGRIQTRNYERDGQRVYVTEVVCESVQFLEPKSTNTTSSRNDYNNSGYQPDVTTNNNDESFSLDSFDPSSDDLPF